MKRAGRHADGGGLYLVVEGDAKRWAFLYQRDGKRRELGLGSADYVSLQAARERAQQLREAIGRGETPAGRRGVSSSFRDVAEEVVRSLKPGWRGAKTEAGWERSLFNHAAPLLDKSIDRITTDDILEVLKPLWVEKPESGGKLRERLEVVFAAATARGLRRGDNPARWRGHLALLLPKRARLVKGHHRALPYVDAPAFMRKLRSATALAARVLEFVILTVAREGTVRTLPWSEISDDIWTLPRERSKNAFELRIPLSRQAMTLIEVRGENDLVFPTRAGKAMTNASLGKVLDSLGYDTVTTVHGFRSTFRDWAGEETEHPKDIIEMAMGHLVGSEAERAYRRLDALAKRRRLLQDWADYLDGAGTR